MIRGIELDGHISIHAKRMRCRGSREDTLEEKFKGSAAPAADDANLLEMALPNRSQRSTWHGKAMRCAGMSLFGTQYGEEEQSLTFVAP